MDFYAKKYTVLMNNEPVEMWIKNDEIKKSKFMDKEVDLSNLNKETIAQIKDNPTKVVNGNNLVDNKNFTSNLSNVVDSQLTLAIQKRDMKTLSRFARSDLVPEPHHKNFLEAINRPTGIRAIMTNTVNKINQKVHTIANKVDNFLVDARERVANQKLDKYLNSYQLKEFNKAPAMHTLDLSKNLEPNLLQLAQNFVKAKDINDLTDNKVEDKILQEEFFKQATRNNHSLDDAKTALFQEVLKNKNNEKAIETVEKVSNQEKIISDMKATIDGLQRELENQKLKEAIKNETLEDFKVLTKNMDAVAKVDLLVENKEYQKLNESEKLKVEDQLLFSKEQTLDKTFERASETMNEKAIETKAIADELKNTTLKPIDKQELNENWKVAQAQNRNQEIPSQKFMNLSAVKFDGVSKVGLENWGKSVGEMREKGLNVPSAEKVNQFIDSSLKNAQNLEKQGTLIQTSKDEYKFANETEKEKLYNQEMKKEQTLDMKEALKSLASEAAFEKIIDQNGNINVDRLMDYSRKLSEVSTQLQQEQKANNVNITAEDLQKLNQSQAATQTAKIDGGRQRA